MDHYRQRPKIIRLRTVQDRTGLSRSTIYAWIEEEKFPKQIKIGGRSTGWVEEDIDNWINDCIQKSQEVAHEV